MQICFLWNLHPGNVLKDPITRIYLSRLRLPQGCLELVGFSCSCSWVGFAESERLSEVFTFLQMLTFLNTAAITIVSKVLIGPVS